MASGLATEQYENVLLDEVFALGHVDALVLDQHAEVAEAVDELEQLRDVVLDAGYAGAQLLEVLFVDLADRLEALRGSLVVRPSSTLNSRT